MEQERVLSNGMATLVSPEDADLLDAYGWYALKDGNHWYAYANVTVYPLNAGNDWDAANVTEPKRTTLKLHRLVAARVLGDVTGQRIDHINRNGLDNRRENLRSATQSQNLVNTGKRKGNHTSQYKGVYFHQGPGGRTPRYRAMIRIGAERQSLGYFDTEEAAAVAFDRAARERYAEFEVLNFVWKICTGCGEDKPEIDYPVRKNRGSGRASRCKACTARAARER